MYPFIAEFVRDTTGVEITRKLSAQAEMHLNPQPLDCCATQMMVNSKQTAWQTAQVVLNAHTTYRVGGGTNINKVFPEPIGNIYDLLAISLPSIFNESALKQLLFMSYYFKQNYPNNFPCLPWDHFHILETSELLFWSYVNILDRQSKRYLQYTQARLSVAWF